MIRSKPNPTAALRQEKEVGALNDPYHEENFEQYLLCAGEIFQPTQATVRKKLGDLRLESLGAYN
jgi:hypothetical protein